MKCDGYKTKRFDSVSYVDAMAVHNQDEKELVIFAVNRSETEAADLEAKLDAFGCAKVAEHVVLSHEDKDAVNSPENPMNVAPKANGESAVENGVLNAKLAPYSWNMIRIALA